MWHARTSFLGLARITVRRMMIYVAVIGLALSLYIHMVREHWRACSAFAAHYSKGATICRSIATRYPGNTIAPPVGYQTGVAVDKPFTGALAAQRMKYYEALVQIYESAKWRPWAVMPTVPPPPPEP